METLNRWVIAASEDSGNPSKNPSKKNGSKKATELCRQGLFEKNRLIRFNLTIIV